MARRAGGKGGGEDPSPDPAAEASLDRLRRELARGAVVLAILSVLGAGRRYGYELLSVVNELTGGVPEIKEGTLYPLLHRLEDAGHVASTWETPGPETDRPQPRRPPRKYYLLTASGEQQLGLLRHEWEQLVDGMARLLGATQGAV